MTVVTSHAIVQAYRGLYHPVDTRYNLCESPPSLDPSSRIRVEQQARSVACLVEKNRLLETRSNGSVQYSIQSPPVLTLACQVEASYHAQYDETKLFKGNFADELCLGDGTAFLIGKQLILTAAHCICDPLTGIISRVKLASLLVVFGFQTQSSGQVQGTFEQRDVFHIDAVWNYVFKKNVADWAIVKLDREVEGRDPLIFADSPMIHLQMQLYMLGHPLGLPLKLTMGAEVKERTKPKRTDEIKEGDEAPLFDADLDAFAGNSGSPIFELERGTIIAMLFAGNNAKFKSNEKTIYVDQVSKQMISTYGYEKCLKISSIDFLKTVLSSSFKMGHTHFAGRMSHLAKLKAHLASHSSSTKVHILYGPGGIGKSELAITFANQSIEDFSFIWSISCGTDEEKWVGYQGLAKRLQIHLDEKETLHSLIQKVHRKLEQNESKPWLLLFDNLQKSPDLLTNPPLPSKGGSILITSYKSPKIHSLPEEMILATEVLPLEFGEALEFLEKVTEKPLDSCKKLLTQIGCYPLVLGQVVSYIKHAKIEVEEYIAGLEKHQALLATQGNQSRASRGTLEAAFSMTLQQLFPSAKKWLFLCSQLNGALIPVSYLKAWLDSEDIPEEQSAIIASLEEHALLRYNVQEEVFSLHLEFQRILRSVAARDIGAEVAHLLVSMKDEWNFSLTSDWRETMKKATIWATHAESVVKVVLLDVLEKAILLDGLGSWESKNACYGKALAYYSEALQIKRAVLGENHSDVAKSLHGIGLCYDFQGNYNMALKVYDEELKIRKTALGENHPDVASSLNNIGACYDSQGNYNEAQRLYGEALEIYRAALGENHPNVAISLANIGNCYFKQGNYSEALKVNVEALKIKMATFGENHPSVALSITSIGRCYFSQGNYNEALKFYDKGLKIRRDTLGENHPDVASSLTGIGSCYLYEGNYNEALKVYGEALNIQRTALGENHPDVALSLSGIGSCNLFKKNYNEALQSHNGALKIQRATLGENHSEVALSLSGIGNCYGSQGNHNEALKIHSEALRIYRVALGENHPDVAMSLINIGNCYDSQRNHTEALKVYGEALKIQRAALGEYHRNVASTLGYIGRCYRYQGKYNEALKVYEEVLKIQMTALRENHPDIGTSLNNIGMCYDIQGNYKEALKVYGEALKNTISALGENHPSVATILYNIKQSQAHLNSGCAIS
jgi:tetratricopeptide (TPR) repeat protein